MRRLTEHFSLDDFAQPADYGFPSVPYPEEWIEERAIPLANALEALRTGLGGSTIVISCGYRTPAFNDVLREEGHPVARDSQHCEGRAVDIIVPGRTPLEVYLAARRLHGEGKLHIGGLGVYSGWVHVDIRPGRLIDWFS